MKGSLVSIIVPVYNAAETLSLMLGALAQQTYKGLELIFVNDCCRDNSLAVLEEAKAGFEQQGMQVKICSHTVNQGVAAARNTGLDQATGDYIYYVDADDWLEPEAIEQLLSEALRTDADIVGCDWYLGFAQKERLMRQPSYASPAEALSLLFDGKLRWNLWVFMVKRSLYEEQGFRFIPDMNMGEDMMLMFKLFATAKKVLHLPRALYHYGQGNEGSLTKTYSKKHMQEVTANMEEIARFLKTTKYRDMLDRKQALLKLTIKLPLLISGESSRYKEWLTWFSESNVHSWDNKVQPWRIRCVQLAAWKRQFWLVKLHYYGLIRLVYGLIYR